MASLSLRVAPPRPFTQNETHDSLTQHKFLFNNFYRKDKDFKPILKSTFRWDSRRDNYGVTPDQADELETLLGNICSLLPFPYLTSRILKETTSWSDVWDIIFNHYQAKPSQDTNLDFVSLKLNIADKETYQTFYERLCHHQRTHLAPRGAIGTGAANLVNDVLTLSHQNLITMFWMQKIDARLPALVSLEFASELQSGTQITALVQRISKRADTLLNSKNFPSATATTVNLIANDAEDGENAVADAINRVNLGNNFRPQPDAQKWRNSRSNQQRPSYAPTGARPRSSPNNQTQKPNIFCPGCQYLGSQLKLQVKYDHYPSDCPRRDGVVKMIQAEQDKEDQENNDVNDILNEINKDSSAYFVFPSQDDPIEQNTILKIYQMSYILSTYKETSPQSLGSSIKVITTERETLVNKNNSNEIEDKPANISDKEDPTLKLEPSWYTCTTAKINRMQSKSNVRKEKSPSLLISLQNASSMATIDEGAELNCIDEEFCLRNNIKFAKTHETATAAGKNDMKLAGETVDDIFLRPQQKETVRWNLGRCVVVCNLGSNILIGEPAKKDNCIVTLPHKKQIIAIDADGSEACLDYSSKPLVQQIKSANSHLCRLSESKVLLQDENLDFALPEHFSDSEVVISPRKDFVNTFGWPKAEILKVVENKVTIPNTTGYCITLKKNEHFADVTLIKTFDPIAARVDKVYDLNRSDLSHLILPKRPEIDLDQSYLADIQIDPDKQLSAENKLKFKNLCEKYSDIITPAPGRYNGYYGRVDNSLHFISNPAPIKARLPNYSHDKLLIQAREMDKMEKYGVLAKPEDLGIVPLHVVPSMLVPKTEPGEYRIVSDFNSLNVHLKKPEVILQTMEEIKRVLAEFEYHAELDLSNYYWQGGMVREDSRYLATPHPFGGLRVYTAEPQGIKGASEHGSERLARVFGDMERDRRTIRHADGIYVLGNSPDEVYDNLNEVFERAKLSGFTFKPKKVIICPKTTQLFGWIKENHAWRPTKHVLSPLASAEKPITVKQLRSWLGAFKQVTECIADYATLIGPLENAVGGKTSQSRVSWTAAMEQSFILAKNSLASVKAIHYPRPDDLLEFYPDYSEEKNAIGGWLKIVRPATIDQSKQEFLGGHFSQRLSPRKVKLIPCEGEALAARCLVNHFRHSLRENKMTSKIFSDNLPVCQAWKKMKTGIWSKSSKVAALLTNLSVYNMEFIHIAGVKQKYGDYNSRNPPRCKLSKCQICKYAFEHAELDIPNMFISHISRVQTQVNISTVTAEQIEKGEVKLPFTEKAGWLKIQKNDKLHRELMRLISSGQTPEKKRTGQHYTLLKRMYNLYRVGLIKVDPTGLIVVRHCDVKGEEFDAISVPEEMYPGLVTALHIKLFHPSRLQMQRLLSRFFFCLNSAKTVDQIQTNCSICTSLSNIPKEIVKQSTTPSGFFGSKFAADVIKQHKQLIFICRENLSQFTISKILPDETADSVREAIISIVLELIPENGTTVRLDPAPGNQALASESEVIDDSLFQILKTDPVLAKYGIKIEIGRVHNVNKNPIAENAVKEFHKERLRLNPEGGPVTEIVKCIIMRNMNQRI